MSVPANQTETPDWDRICTESLQDGVYFLSAILDPDFGGAFNPDVLGFGVRLSSLVMNICAAILIRWGTKKDADAALQSTLIQIGSIVLCTLISLFRDQLYFLDGLFTLAVVHSPIAWYILWINARGVYSRRPTHGFPINVVLCFTVLCGWISLHVVVWFKGRKIPGHNCEPISLETYFVAVLLEQSFPITNGDTADPFFWTVLALGTMTFLIYTRRYRARWATPYRKNFWSGIRVRLKRHIWVIYLPIIYSYVNWSRFQLVVFSVEPGYAFTYGQSLSVMAAVPSLVSVFNLVLKLRLADLALGWRAFVSELLFLLIGNGPLAGSINEKYFHGQLVLPPLESESFSLPFFHPPTPSAPTLPDVVLEPPATPAYGVADSDPTSAPGSDEQPPGRPSQDISDAYVTELTDSTPASSESHADTGQSAVRTSSLDLANPVPAEHIHIPANSTSILGLADDTNAIPGAPATQETIPCSDSPVEMMPSELMGTLPPRSIDGDSEATRVSVPANVPSEPDVGDLGNTGPSEPESSNNASGISRRDTTMRKRTIQLDHPSSVAEENS